MLKKTVATVIGLFCALPIFMFAALASAATEEIIKDGILHVMNDSAPTAGVETVVLEEVWRKGGDDGEEFFGMVAQVVVTDDDHIYLLDTRLSEVAVYSVGGERLTTLSREGDGPGESRRPSNMLLMPDGTLGLVQIFPGRVIKVALDGTPAGQFQPDSGDPTAGGFLRIFDCTTNGREMVVTGQKISESEPGVQDRLNYVATFGTDGQERVRFWEHHEHVDYSAFELNEDKRGTITFRRVAAGRDGRVYVASQRNAYTIDVYTADGKLERVIERAFEHRRRSDKEHARMQSYYEEQLSRLPNPNITASRTYPDIASIQIGHDGNLWVASSRSGIDQSAGVMFTWDVFSPEGHFIKQVAAVSVGDGEQDMLMWTPSGNAIMVTGFRDARQNLRRRGGGTEDESGVVEPMEVVYLRRVHG